MNLKKFINITWYMELKPYTKYTDYDVFYLEVCRNLFTIIDKVIFEYDYDEDVFYLVEEDKREMAYAFTAYFEDQVNEIGFWKSLTALHTKHFGKRLPFFDATILQQQEEEWEDILPADIHYLAYILYVNFLTDADGKTKVFFNMPFFITLTERVIEYLVEIEEVFTTTFYEKYLVPAEDYFDFRNQLDWFTFRSYLTGIEFSRTLNDYICKLQDKKTDENLMAPLAYAERDRMLYEIPSSLTAFFPVDIMAGAIRCSDKKKEEIRNLKWRPHGIFNVQSESDTYFRFLHTSTGEEFDVLKSSFHNPLDISKQKYWISTLARWNSEYFISGMSLPCKYRGEELYRVNLDSQHSFQKHFPAYRMHIAETALKYSNEALAFFGNPLVFFDTGNDLQKRINEFNQWYFDSVAGKTTNVWKDKKPPFLTLPEKLLTVPGITLFISPANGLQFIIEHRQLLHILQRKDADKVSFQQIEEVFHMLLDAGLGAEYWIYVKKNFPVPNLSLFMKCPIEADEDFEALLRIYLPGDFSETRLPGFSISSPKKPVLKR